MSILKELEIPNIDTLIGIALFGSFKTEYWSEGRSDIDILVLLEYKKSISFEFNVEDILDPILKKYFSYNNIHITFLYMNEFDSPLAIQLIESENKLIVEDIKFMEFRLYVNKYIRNNQWLKDLVEKDKEILRRERNESIL
ncbi:MAG: nucleotidyltransferase domain-containing protein [Clostridium sp.]|uniref:nucleotidyltransferase domain-containing protein n=1 Tax=Clostridium sp. TaxID=1506 RepID=UPI0030468C96